MRYPRRFILRKPPLLGAGLTFVASLKGSVIPELGFGAPSFTRATTANGIVNWEGKYQPAVAGEVRFQGLRRVQNIELTNTVFAGAVANTTPPTGWTRLAATGTFAPSTATAPRAGDGAQRLDFTITPGNREFMGYTVNLVAGRQYVLSVYCEAKSGTLNDSSLHLVAVTATFSGANNVPSASFVVGQRIASAVLTCTVSGTATFRIGIGTGTFETGTGSISLSCPMFEDVTGRSNQNPSEYVPVGAAKRNEFTQTEDFTQAVWTKSGATVTGDAATAPNGTVTADKLAEDASVGNHAMQQAGPIGTPTLMGYRLKAAERSWAVLQVGSGATWFDLTNGVTGTTSNTSAGITPLGNGWFFCWVYEVNPASVSRWVFVTTGNGVSSYAGVAGNGIYVWGAQQQFNVTTPGTYFPVGNAYQYPVTMLDGNVSAVMADGVAQARYLNGNTVTNNVVTEAAGVAIPDDGIGIAVYPTATAAAYTTPAAAANQLTGDMRVEWWTPGLSSYTAAAPNIVMASKRNPTSTEGEFQFSLTTTGSLQFVIWTAPSTTKSVSSTVLVQNVLPANVAVWFAVDKFVNLSGGNWGCRFYYSFDRVTWTLIEQVAGSGDGTAMVSAANTLSVGSSASGLSAPHNILRMLLYRGTGTSATLTADFNPSDWTTGTTWVSRSTGETWSMSGVVAVRKWPFIAITGEEATTNIILQSGDIGTTWAASGVTIGSSIVGPDGTLSMKKMAEDGTTADHFISQAVAKAASAVTYTFTACLKQAERLNARVRIDGSSSNGFWVDINLQSGVLSAVTAIGAGWSAASAISFPLGDGIWGVSLTATSDTALFVRGVVECEQSSGVVNYTGTVGSGIYAGCLQLEAKAYRTSYVPTTTVAVTRNIEIFTMPAAGNASVSAGVIYTESMLTPGCFGVMYLVGVNDGTVNNRALSFTNGPASTVGYRVTSGGVAQLSNVGVNNLPAAGTISKDVIAWSASHAVGFLNGVLDRDTGAAITPPAAFTRIDFGVNEALTGGSLSGGLRNVKIWNRSLDNGNLQVITS